MPVSFLHPGLGLLAAGLALPLLLLLYFLKLRRVSLRLSSTLLWRQAYEDLQVNAPFQRLRWSLLLLVQLLLLLALVAAIADPVLEGGGAQADRMILILDRSASMNATIEEGITRFDLARNQGRELIDRLGEGRGAREMMIIAMGRTPEIVCGFETDKNRLREVLGAIEPTDEEADFARALEVAGAFASEGATREDESAAPPDIVLLSDGGVGSGSGEIPRLPAGKFRFLPIPGNQHGATPARNIGITDISARRDYDDPARVLLFLRLVGASEKETPAVVTILIDGEPVATRRLSIPPATEDSPGEITATLALNLPGSGVITVRHNLEDALISDNTAALIMPPPHKLHIALVHHSGADPDTFLQNLLAAMEPERLTILSQAAFEQVNPAELEYKSVGENGRTGGFDLLVFDQVEMDAPPPIPSLSFGFAPSADDRPEESTAGRRIVSWNRLHPIMRHVSLDNLVYAGSALVMETSSGSLSGGEELASGPNGVVIKVREDAGTRRVVVGFPLRQSNWPTQVGLAIFLQNAIDYLTLAASGQQGLVFQPGEPVRLKPLPGAETVEIQGVGVVKVHAGEKTPLVVANLPRVGVYAVSGVRSPMDRVAISVLSRQESDLKLRSTLRVNAENSGSVAVADLTSRELWPVFIGLALILAIVEWLIYCVRIKGY